MSSIDDLVARNAGLAAGEATEEVSVVEGRAVHVRNLGKKLHFIDLKSLTSEVNNYSN